MEKNKFDLRQVNRSAGGKMSRNVIIAFFAISLLASPSILLAYGGHSRYRDQDLIQDWDPDKEKEYQRFKKMIDDSNIDMNTAYEFAKRYKDEREGESQQKRDHREQRANDAQQKKNGQRQKTDNLRSN